MSLRSTSTMIVTATGLLLAPGCLNGHGSYWRGQIRAGGMSADGTRLVVAGKAPRSHHAGLVQVWEIATGQNLFERRTTEVISAAAISPDGRLIAFREWDHPQLSLVHLDDQAQREQVLSKPGGFASLPEPLRFSSRGRLLASPVNRSALRIWESDTLEHIVDLEPGDEVHAIAFARDDLSIAIGTRSGKVVIFDTSGWGREHSFVFEPIVVDIGYCGSGNTLAVMTMPREGRDFLLRGIDVKSGHEMFRVPGCRRPDVLVTPDGGELVVSATSRTLGVLDPRTGVTQTLSCAGLTYPIGMELGRAHFWSLRADHTVTVWEWTGQAQAAARRLFSFSWR